MTVTEYHDNNLYFQEQVYNCNRWEKLRQIVEQQKDKFNNCCIIETWWYGINIPDRNIKFVVTH